MFFFIVFGAVCFFLSILFIGVIYGTFSYVTLTCSARHGDRVLTVRHAHWVAYRSRLENIRPIKEPAAPDAKRQGTRWLQKVWACGAASIARVERKVVRSQRKRQTHLIEQCSCYVPAPVC